MSYYNYLFFCLFVPFLWGNAIAQGVHDIPGLVAPGVNKGIIPISVESSEGGIEKRGLAAFNVHGAYKLVEGKQASFVIQIEPAGQNTVQLYIRSGSGRNVAFQATVRGNSLQNAVFKACDLAVEKTKAIPGFFATQLAFVSDKTGHKEIWKSDLFFTRPQKLTGDRSYSLNPQFSPDGSNLIYTGYYKSGFPDLYLIDLVSGKRRVFADARGTNTGGVFSPNGQWVASVLSVSGNPEVWLSTAGRKSFRQITKNKSVEASPTWSRDGKELIFTSDLRGSPQLFRISTRGGVMKRIPTNISGYCSEPDWNLRDPNKVVFTAATGGSFQLAIYDFTQSKSTFLTGGGGDCVEPSWANDGRHIIFTRKFRQNKSLWVIDSETQKMSRLHSEKFGNAMQADLVY